MKQHLHSYESWAAYFNTPRAEAALSHLYTDTGAAKLRFLNVAEQFAAAFHAPAFSYISAPGRTELCGNHTDHQRGRVLAAAVEMDILAAAAPTGTGRARIVSQGYGLIDIDLARLAPRADERNTTAALIRGVAAGIREAGYKAEGFDAYITSQVPQGSGLSSSAAFEVLIGSIWNFLYNEGRIPAIEIAKIGQFAENRFFGKPCGLMDQAASSIGGVVLIDFEDTRAPRVRGVSDAALRGSHMLAVVNAGGSHANLTQEYADITLEMCDVARQFGQEVLCGVSPALFYETLHQLRGKVRDRAILRAMHFFEEDARVIEQAAALERGDIGAYMALMRASGESSFMWLQNVYPARDSNERSLPLALAFARRQLEGGGAWRVHGGGFAGTIQVLLQKDQASDFAVAARRMFGQDCFHPLYIRRRGGHLFERDIHYEEGNTI